MKQILLVDDNEKLLDGLLRHFRAHRKEWQVATAGNGVEALRLARNQTFDLLITDILMPEMDGIETVENFQRDHPCVKIVAMSGGGRHVDSKPLIWARRLGANATLTKPFEFEELRETIRDLLEPPSTHPQPEAGTS